MSNSNRNFDEEPNRAPESNRWYNIRLGPSFNDHSFSSQKYCTLRYEFKPASIDKSPPGLLHKRKDNRVAVEFQNNQHGKPKVIFDGVSEDYKENDAVLFFDGETFRLERLHHAVKRLRHCRLPGESAAAATTTATAASVVVLAGEIPEPVAKGVNLQSLNQEAPDQTPEVEERGIGDSDGLVNTESIESGQQMSIKDEETPITERMEIQSRTGLDIDINLPHQTDTDDDEIANVDMSDEETEKGLNAAEALKAQVIAAEGRDGGTSSSSSSSESDGSGSESSSSSSDSESSEGDSVISI